MMKIPAQIDLEAAPGRKSSHGVEFDSEVVSKSLKFRFGAIYGYEIMSEIEI